MLPLDWMAAWEITNCDHEGLQQQVRSTEMSDELVHVGFRAIEYAPQILPQSAVHWALSGVWWLCTAIGRSVFPAK